MMRRQDFKFHKKNERSFMGKKKLKIKYKNITENDLTDKIVFLWYDHFENDIIFIYYLVISLLGVIP